MSGKKSITPLDADCYYHIFNRSVDKELIFREIQDYYYFLNRLEYYVAEYINIFAYCLLPNHFHLLIRVNDSDDENYNYIVSNKFRTFFISYVTYLNMKYGRRGSLLCKPFKRLKVLDMTYLKRLIFYIHYNPQKHGVVNNYKSFPLSSYSSYLKKKYSIINRKEALNWFNDEIDEFIEFHDYLHEEKSLGKLTMED